MLFNSTEYLIFFLVALFTGWALVGFPKIRIWFLLLASYYFYASNNHWLILLFLANTQVDYFCAKRIEDTKKKSTRKTFLVLSMISNLTILGFFKYFNFFASSVSEILSSIGYNLTWVDLNIALPVGISFYTFQSMSYTIDVFRGELKAERSWYKFSFFVAYFPQLVAGPIVRPKDFLPQLYKKPKLNIESLELSLVYIFRGLFKKIVLGDFLATYADVAFNGPTDTFSAWLGVLAFTFQIYFDFSGYSDIAIGCARLMGFKIPENFRRPYMSVSITDFWRRWHISLSSWLRDYLYIPLGGNRTKTKFRTYYNLMVTMLLGGLWHGAAWHFVLWGGLQGIMLSVERALGIGRNRSKSNKFNLSNIIRILLVFILVNFSWIIFRAESNLSIIEAFNSLTTWNPPSKITYGAALALIIIIAGFLNQAIDEYTNFFNIYMKLPVIVKAGYYVLVILAILFFNTGEAKPFIYFQF